MSLIEPVPAGSIYLWCYAQGLRGVSWDEILSAIAVYGIEWRDKDYDNWLEGMNKFLGRISPDKLRGVSIAPRDIRPKIDPRIIPNFNEYPLLDCDSKAYEKTRWVPCNKDNKPLVKWSEVRCTFDEARLWPHAKYLAENLKGCRWIVLDFDVDHDKNDIDLGLKEFGMNLLEEFPTQALYKPDWMGFHLTYWTDRAIPTKHLPHAKIDICGNSLVGALNTGTAGQLRYFKTKVANDVSQVRLLTEDIWKKIQEYSLTKDISRKVK